jgi:DNA-binding NtrC family response regulator
LVADSGIEEEGTSRLGTKRQKRVLIVEDDLQARLGLQQLIRSIGYDVEGVGDWLEALRLMKEEGFDLAIVDIFLSRVGIRSLDGLDLIPLLRILNPGVPVVVVTGQADEWLRANAYKRGATLYLEKPVEPGRLTQIVHQLLNQVAERDVIPPDP